MIKFFIYFFPFSRFYFGFVHFFPSIFRLRYSHCTYISNANTVTNFYSARATCIYTFISRKNMVVFFAFYQFSLAFLRCLLFLFTQSGRNSNFFFTFFVRFYFSSLALKIVSGGCFFRYYFHLFAFIFNMILDEIRE